MKKDFRPSQKVLERYARVLVNFGLGKGKGIKPGDVVYVVTNEYAKPLYSEIRKAILRTGGHIISDYRPDVDEFNFEKEFLTLANDQQISFFPDKYWRGVVDQADHMLFVISETDKHALLGVDPKRIMQRGLALKPYMQWRNEKENQGKFSWTIGLYGTPLIKLPYRYSGWLNRIQPFVPLQSGEVKISKLGIFAPPPPSHLLLSPIFISKSTSGP